MVRVTLEELAAPKVELGVAPQKRPSILIYHGLIKDEKAEFGYRSISGYLKLWKYYEMIRERDNNQCQICGSTEDLEIHHITRRWEVKRNPHAQRYILWKPFNLVTLCKKCHPRGMETS